MCVGVWFNKLSELFSVCAICGKWGTTLCATCRRSFSLYPPSLEEYRYLRSFYRRPLVSYTEKPTTLSMYYYGGRAKKVMGLYKKRGYRAYGVGLQKLMGEYARLDPFNIIKTLKQDIKTSTKRTYLTYIPPSPKNRKARMFDHIRILAHKLSQILGLKLIQVFEMHPKPDSKTLDRSARLSAIKSALHISKTFLSDFARHKALYNNNDTTFIIFDDVSTTGATLFYAQTLIRKHFPHSKSFSFSLFKTPLKYSQH